PGDQGVLASGHVKAQPGVDANGNERTLWCRVHARCQSLSSSISDHKLVPLDSTLRAGHGLAFSLGCVSLERSAMSRTFPALTSITIASSLRAGGAAASGSKQTRSSYRNVIEPESVLSRCRAQPTEGSDRM